MSTGAWIRQIKYVVMMTKEGSPKIVNFMTPWMGLWPLSHYCENALSSLSVNSTLKEL